MKPLEGYTVVDLTHVLAGPYCTYQLGLLGAEVTKVESPKGDMTRIWGGTREQIAQRLGTGFSAQNAGKKSVIVDISRDAGAEIVRALAAKADIFVENFRPGAMARHGLDYDTLAVSNPRLIYLSISAFGQNGPLGHRPGFDDVVQATSGFMSINERGDGPIRTGGPVLDYATGMHAASAVLSAALIRERTGKGQRVDVAMQDVAMLLINRQVSYTATTGELLPPSGNRDDFLLGRFATRDGLVMLAGYLPHHQRSILSVLGLDEFTGLSGAGLRARARDIEAAVEATLLTRTTAEWDAQFAEAAVVAGGVRDLLEVLESGQPEARRLLTAVDSAAGEVQVTNAGYLINDRAFEPAADIPSLGQHTEEVLRSLGHDSASIETLAKNGVVALPGS